MDANVLVKCWCDEEGRAESLRLLSEPRALVVPSHALAEVFEVLIRHNRRRGLGLDEILSALDQLGRRLTVSDIKPLLPSAIEIARMAQVSIYDALYVALTAVLPAPFVTADLRLVRSLAGTAHGRWTLPLPAVTFPLPVAP